MRRSVKIGVVGPMSGPRSAYGVLLANAARTSIRGLDIIFADDQGEPDEAVNAASKLISADVKVVIGHFNSDCARRAGPLYRQAEIPFLMPAATAPDLIRVTNGYRVCPTDEDQVAAMIRWVSQSGASIVIEDDGSSYGRNLAHLLRGSLPAGLEIANIDDPNVLRVMMGTHIAVATAIKRNLKDERPILVPDDCSIAEFEELISGAAAQIFVAQPQPNFSAAVKIALGIVAECLAEARDIGDVLRDHEAFESGQYKTATFEIVRSSRAIS